MVNYGLSTNGWRPWKPKNIIQINTSFETEYLTPNIPIWKCPIPASSEAAAIQLCPCCTPWLFHPSPGTLSLTHPHVPATAPSPALTITSAHTPHPASLGCYHLLLPSPVLEPSSHQPLQWWGTGHTGKPPWPTVPVPFLARALATAPHSLQRTQTQYWRAKQDIVIWKPQRKSKKTRAGLGMSNLCCFNYVFLECHFSVNPIFWL